MNGWIRCTEGHDHFGRDGAAGLLITAGHLVLLQLRAGHVHHPRTWALPGGALLAGEGAPHAALREAREEGVPVERLELLNLQYQATCGGWTYTTVLARAVGSPWPVLGVRGPEAAGYRWTRRDSVVGLRLHPAFRDAWCRGLHDLVAANGH